MQVKYDLVADLSGTCREFPEGVRSERDFGRQTLRTPTVTGRKMTPRHKLLRIFPVSY
jgi:hypothetical protein